MKMIDALYPQGIPAGTTCDAIAAYIDHEANPDSFMQAQARFPDALHSKITVKGTVGADILDCEESTAESKPSQAIEWVVASRKAGLDPTVYCNELNTYDGWAPLRTAFAAAGVPEPHWWVANYDRDPTIPDGALGKQYTDLDPSGRNTYDTSNMTAIPGHIGKETDLDATQNQRLIDIQAKVDQDHYAITHSILPALARLDAARAATPATVEAAVKQAMPSATDADAQAIAAAVLAALGAALAPQQGTAGTDTTKGVQ